MYIRAYPKWHDTIHDLALQGGFRHVLPYRYMLQGHSPMDTVSFDVQEYTIRATDRLTQYPIIIVKSTYGRYNDTIRKIFGQLADQRHLPSWVEVWNWYNPGMELRLRQPATNDKGESVYEASLFVREQGVLAYGRLDVKEMRQDGWFRPLDSDYAKIEDIYEAKKQRVMPVWNEAIHRCAFRIKEDGYLVFKEDENG
jgi:hypothetical protein